MKKRTIIIASICLGLGLCLCLGIGIFLLNTNNSVSEEEWQAMLDASNFENYTLSQSGEVTLSSGEQSNTYQQDLRIKFTEDKVHLTEQRDGAPYGSKVFGEKDVETQKKIYESVFLALLADYNNFAYDSKDEAYTNATAITVTIDLSEQGANGTSTVVMENGKVTLDEDGKLLKITCKLTQTSTTEIQGHGTHTVTSTSDITWQFSDYGTTAIAE